MPEEQRQVDTADIRPDPEGAATTDPLVGTQETTDSLSEAAHTPTAEMTLEPQPATGRGVKSRRVAGWLGIFLGGLGLHRLYLGFISIGLFQMILFLGGAALVIAIAAARGAPLGTAALIGLGAMSIVPLWGAIEGLFILMGGLNRDRHGRPLAA